MLAIYVVAAALLVVLALRIVVFYFIARWLKAGDVTWPRIIGIEAIMLPLAIGATLVQWYVQATPDTEGRNNALAIDVVLAAIVLIILAFVVKAILRGSVWKGVFAMLLAAIFVALPAVIVLKEFVLDSFRAPTLSMAPTLLGWHWVAKCPHCGGRFFLRANLAGNQQPPPENPPFGICEQCLKAGTAGPHSDEIFQPDRFVALKFLKPRRWDVVTVWTVGEAPMLVAKRIVGLPGEEVTIKDGAVWINGNRQTPPGSLAALEYIEIELESWKLKDGEFFVLGDLSARSYDSRMWGPSSLESIDGVVTTRYWPPSRWGILR
jgi:signal peptidase I